MQHSDITEKIIACAYKVHNEMGFGFLESVYEKCMLLELAKAGFDAEAQKSIKVLYGDQVVGNFVADIIVNDTIVVELKSIEKIIKTHEVQLVNYLVARKRPIGLIINFARDKVEIKRKVREL